MVTCTKSQMKEINANIVMNCYYHYEGISRIEISNLTNLNKSTLTIITRNLQDDGLIIPCGSGGSTSSGGRNKELFTISGSVFYYIGINFGKYAITAALVNVNGDILAYAETPTDPDSDPELMINESFSLIDDLLGQSGKTLKQISGIGISVSGLVDNGKGIVVCSPNLAWNDIRIAEIFRNKYNTVVCADNNTRCIARGELWFGNARTLRSFICINIAYGVGSAIVSDYKVITDTQNFTSEIGHITMHENGPVCRCGKQGCLETYVGGKAIAGEAQSCLNAGAESLLKTMSHGDIAAVTAKMVADAAEQGDAIALNIIRNAAKKLGLALSYAVNLLDPEAVLLEGGVSRAKAGFIQTIQETMNKNIMYNRKNECKLIRGKLGKNAELIGAVTMVMEQYGFRSKSEFMDMIKSRETV